MSQPVLPANYLPRYLSRTARTPTRTIMRNHVRYLILFLAVVAMAIYCALYSGLSSMIWLDKSIGPNHQKRLLAEERIEFQNAVRIISNESKDPVSNIKMNLPIKESINKVAKKDNTVTTTLPNNSLAKTTAPQRAPSNNINGSTNYENRTVEWLIKHHFVSKETRYDFKFLINNPNSCRNEDGGEKPVFFLVLVISQLKNFAMRKLVRETWGSVTEFEGKGIVTVFLIARSPIRDGNQENLEIESNQYHDIIQGDFIDTYKNLSLKTIMGMKWAGSFCSHAKYVMKTDDDMFVGFESLVRHLSDQATPTHHFMTGYTILAQPIQDVASKWYMSPSIYPYDRYPVFCSGTGYVVSGDLPRMIYETARLTPFIYLEDVLVAICVCKLDVVPVWHKDFHNYVVSYGYCNYKKIFTTHLFSTPIEQKYAIWHDLTSWNNFNCPRE